MIRYLPAALVGLLLLAGCADYRYGAPLPGDVRLPRYERPVDSRRASAEWRRTPSDARRFVADLDRRMVRFDRRSGLDRNQRARIERIVENRTYALLERTHVRDHRRVYPLPRVERTREQQAFWRATDREIERVLDRRQRETFRDLTLGASVREERRGRDDGRRGPVGAPRARGPGH
ncbi:MAG: hypothetical protein ACK41D_04995 [Rubricoccaceae bacterium]